MKRSEVEDAIRWAKSLLEKQKFVLPRFAYWTIEEWQRHKAVIGRLRDLMLGWDITDYGLDDFRRVGSVLFTVRNGDQKNPDIGTPYAEKLIPIHDGQRLPLHFHFQKTEDIINRGGGVMYIKLYNAKQDKSVDYQSDVEVYMDGIKSVCKAGEEILVHPGNSITLTPYMYHLFGAKEGFGDVLIGEVSSVNDDNADNYFAENVRRFSTIEEDVPVTVPLCNEYARWLKI